MIIVITSHLFLARIEITFYANKKSCGRAQKAMRILLHVVIYKNIRKKKKKASTIVCANKNVTKFCLVDTSASEDVAFLAAIILPGHFVGLIGNRSFFCPAPESFPGRTAETGGEAAQDEGDDEQRGEEVDFLLHISDRLRFSSGKYTEDSLKSNNNLSKFNKLSLKFSKPPPPRNPASFLQRTEKNYQQFL